jgi:hypothetical protein
VARKRTAGMTAIGVANVAFGALGAVTTLVTALLVLVSVLTGHIPLNELWKSVHEIPAEAWVSLVAIPSAGILDVLLVIAGIQVLRMRPSGPTASLAYAVLVLPLCFVDFWMVRGSGPMRIVLYPLSCVSPSYSLLLVVLFLRPSWRRAFECERPLTPSDSASSGTAC